MYITATRAVRHPEDIVLMIERFHARQRAQGVRYTECFISTSLHLRSLGPDELCDRGLPFEVCPRSNIVLGIVAADRPHPIRAMLDAGLNCTLNSDDPAMFDGDLIAEYLTLAEQGFSWAELRALSRATLEATFLDADEKAGLRAEWDAFA